MKTIFDFSDDNSILKLYEIGSDERINSAFIQFWRSVCNHEIPNVEYDDTHYSHHYEGDKKLVYLPDEKIACQEFLGKEYKGQVLASNVGVASHGCDHFYDDIYEYRYSRLILPKNITMAIKCMNRANYYSNAMYHEFRDSYTYGKHYSILEEEKRELERAKEYLLQATDISADDYAYHSSYVWLINFFLDAIEIVKKENIPISCPQDILKIFEEKRHPAKNSLYSYLITHKYLKTIDELFASLNEKGTNYAEEVDRRMLRETFFTSTVTPEWLSFINDVDTKVKEVEEKRMRLRRYY